MMMRASAATLSALMSGCCGPARGGARSTTALLINMRNPAVSFSSAAIAWNRQQADKDDYMHGREGRCRRRGFVVWHCHARGFATKKRRKLRDAAVPTLRLEQLKALRVASPTAAAASALGTPSEDQQPRPHPLTQKVEERPLPQPQTGTGVLEMFSATNPADFSSMDPIAQATVRWVRSNVVGLNLCPWAGSALTGGHMRVVVFPEKGAEKGQEEEEAENEGGRDEVQLLLLTAAAEAAALGALEGPAAANATTLIVVHPSVELDFVKFLSVAEAVDDFLDIGGLRGTVQLATFHPQYRFEGSTEDDAANFTNRSPYPVLHLLLEDQVEAAIEQIGDPAKVWQKNVQTMKAIGAEAMRLSVAACKHPDRDADERR